jgi:SHS2 domain-containing protein
VPDATSSTFLLYFFVLSYLRATVLTSGLSLQLCIHLCRRGETFNRHRHVAGTEIKAITYSAMQIHEREGDAEVFVIVDI